jgi:TonB-linked SusC/RagA family outer membrane protein
VKPGSYLAGVAAGIEGGLKRDYQDHRLDLTISNRLNYNLFVNDHSLNILGLYEYNQNEFNRILAESTQFPSPLLSTQTNGALKREARSNRDRLTLVSYGAFADYNYKERYYLSGSVRRDGSSNFGADVRWGTFYSGSVAWNIANESFFDVAFIDDLKFRGSYGSVGNRSGLGRYEAQGTVTFDSYPGGSSTIPDQVANPELTWETTTTTNIGLEFNAFNNRLRLVSDYFIRKTTDLLFPVQTAFETGAGTITRNIGDIENKGLEISLQGDVFRTSDFTWTLGGNILFLDHKILKLPNGDPLDAPNTFNIRWEEGRKINEHFLIRYAGVDPETGRGQFYGGDGNLYFADELPEDQENRVFQGKSTIADLEGGFFTNVTYKGFGLRTDFVFKAGNWINNTVKARSTFDGSDIGFNQTVDAFNYWQQPGDTDVAPSPKYAVQDRDIYYSSDRWLEKGDYIRLRNVTLSYTFPKKYLEKTPLTSLRIYAQGQNLLTFTKFWGDPEVGISSGESISFADTVAPGETTLYSYPNTKSYQMGIDVSF